MKFRAIIALLLVTHLVRAQGFFEPADTLIPWRRNLVVGGTVAVAGGLLVGLNQAWYADYEQSAFHTIDDNTNWYLMDKLGHVQSAYSSGAIMYRVFSWSGMSRRNALWYGGTSGFLFLTAVEIMDGHSAGWGFSWGDVAANTLGCGLFLSQELLWKEQRLIPKFSFHSTSYASQNPGLLGADLTQQWLKDYNGQTYWLSADVQAFTGWEWWPEWLMISGGYGIDGFVTSDPGQQPPGFVPDRQWYLSLDFDLRKVRTKSDFLNTLIHGIGFIKIPAPTLEWNREGVRGHWLYF